jgi:hypothetical protein
MNMMTQLTDARDTPCAGAVALQGGEDHEGDGAEGMPSGAGVAFLGSGGEQLFFFETELLPMTPDLKKPKSRKPVVPPAVVPPGMSVFDYLRQCSPPLDKKIIDIACSKAHVEPGLREDAAQEIRFMWMTLKPDPTAFSPGQIASYATRMAEHAALRLRREVGSAVRLPGSAFRKKKDGTTYVTPGVLAQALPWDELEGWFLGDSAEGSPVAHQDPHGLEAYSIRDAISTSGEHSTSEDPESEEEEATRQERIAFLEKNREALSERQFSLMEGLINGERLSDLMQKHNIKKAVLTRELAVASAILGPLEDLE